MITTIYFPNTKTQIYIFLFIVSKEHNCMPTDSEWVFPLTLWSFQT